MEPPRLRGRSQVLDKFFGRYTRLLEDARERAGADFFVVGDDATRRTAAENNVTASLPCDAKSHSLEGAEAFPAAHARELRHAPTRRWS